MNHETRRFGCPLATLTSLAVLPFLAVPIGCSANDGNSPGTASDLGSRCPPGARDGGSDSAVPDAAGPDAQSDGTTPPPDAGAGGTFYDLPNDNGGCPGNCRQIPWSTGSDLWNGGTLPQYASVTCAGLHADGVTDDAPGINACIAAAAPNTAVYLPAGTYYVNQPVRLMSSVVVRGAGTSTVLNLGANGQLTTQNFSSSDASSLNPPTTYGQTSNGLPLTGAPQKGDTTVTLQNAGDANVGDWISIFADDDPSLVTAMGEDGFCQWCGDQGGQHFMQQIVQVAAKSGATLTLSRPLYYTLFTHPQFRKYTFGTQKAGYENLKAVGYEDIGANPIIDIQGCLYCWVKGVETYDTGSSSESAHIRLQYSYGGEVRDSYVHFGRSSASGSNYGIYLEWINTDHKIENNVMRNNRHGLVFQGGGSGVAFLYNYVDDLYTDDLTYLGSGRTSHGAHPYMNLLEGNVLSHVTADDFIGSSSHTVFFRNWIQGDETGTGVPELPSWGFYAIDVFPLQTYYSFVGNVLGKPAGGHVDWSTALLLTDSASACGNGGPVVYHYGCDSAGNFVASPKMTSINHGNYDYLTQGVAYWEGGPVHALKPSMYYASKPTWYGGCAWPPVDPTTPTTADIPAKLRYQGQACP